MARRSGLGKGLSALIPAEAAVAERRRRRRGPAARAAGHGRSSPTATSPGQAFDEEALASLTASVRELGRAPAGPGAARSTTGTYELIAGERRWRAARRAGLDRIPPWSGRPTTSRSLEQAVVENLHRADLNPLEEAAAYQQLIEEFQLTHEQVATRVGKSRVAVTNALRLFQLPPGVQKLVAEGQLSGGHAKALLGTPDRAFLEHLARRAVSRGPDGPPGRGGRAGAGASSRAGPVAGRTQAAVAAAGGQPAATRDPGLLELEELLADFLATRVGDQAGSGGRGKLVIEFADLEDLERIYRQIAAATARTRRDDLIQTIKSG